MPRLADARAPRLADLRWWDWPADRIPAAAPTLMSGDPEALAGLDGP